MTILDEMLSRLKGDVARVRLFERERVLLHLDETIRRQRAAGVGVGFLNDLRNDITSGRPGYSGAAEGNEAAVGAEAPAVGSPDQPGLPDVVCDIVALLLDIRSDQNVRPGAAAAAARLERWLMARTGAFMASAESPVQGGEEGSGQRETDRKI